MTDPAAIAALASVWTDDDIDEKDEWWITPRPLAESILTHPFTPAERAAIAAAVLTPEVLATVICSTWDMPSHDHEAFLQPDHCEDGIYDAKVILAALRDAGKEPDHE